mmetsp:Transcript_21420/g.32862  ORF Transcript_21420/g.32862 Transcript_21420/m.32862 type:complete len:240 (-) Transcript_21420:270-989(-)|eukprot:CAMPEP_0197315406 /NCGR_PEP_ID=MMETSP0891-20130614/38134_1 /TAXON_ID=44058 ORGANISM="Aureoumbra lagunensis, Strain CCMP1510" /NCGR_SAMPLE_ID=MMETSP0891 /ASSEMBLY_ACC=CAM_ASM_000534 /LENGTH=239 /DNA_ID=CAMNT_0042804351 /DNA_START=1483 /DNA_END=2202 /DNA_ORIENTATION=-
MPTALESHPEWNDEQKELYHYIKTNLFPESEDKRLCRRIVQARLLLKKARLDSMNFETQWNGRWPRSIGYSLIHIHEAIAAGVDEWKTLEAFLKEKKKKDPPSEEKKEKRSNSLKRKIDKAFRENGKEPLDDIDAYEKLPQATVRLRKMIRSRKTIMKRKADRYEREGLPRRYAYDSAGDTDLEDMTYSYKRNIVSDYLKGIKTGAKCTMNDIANHLAKTTDGPPPSSSDDSDDDDSSF